MKSLIDIYDPTGNFWDLNPQFKTMSPFNELYKKDRKRTKLDSSRDMWFVSGILDKKSNYSDIEENPNETFGQYRSISKDIAKDENWLYDNYERLEPYFKAWGRYAETRASRLMAQWYDKMEERTKVMNETKYEVGITDSAGRYVGSNIDMLDKMVERNPKMWDTYLKYEEMLASEGDGEGTVKGDSVASAADLGKI